METLIESRTIKKPIQFHTNIFTAILPAVFIMLNALKMTFFNLALISPNASQDFSYRLSLNVLLSIGIYIFLMGSKSRLPFALFYAVQVIYLFSNLAYYFYFHSYLHISQSISLLTEGIGAAGHMAIPASPRLLMVLLDLPGFVLLLIIYRRLKLQGKWQRVIRAGLTLFCSLIFAATLVHHNVNQYAIFAAMKTDSSLSESQVVQRYGTIANNLADVILNSDEKSLINNLKYGQNLVSAGNENKTKPNFVMVQVESMDANAVNKQHNGQYVMPFLHSLAQNNIYYPYTMSYHEAGETSDTEFSIINSVEPLSSFPSIKLQNYSYTNSIVKQLNSNGYSTSAFHGNIGTYFNRDMAYPKMGYKTFTDMKQMGLKDIGWGAPDDQVFSYVEKQLQKEKQPFFAYIITMTSHGPFTNAGNYYHNDNYNDVQDKPARDYMNSMSYVDQSLAGYVNYIRANCKNTYIFIWGDHTPSIINDDYRQASFTVGDKYYEFVPLIIITPDYKVYQENKIAASFLDIGPTILNTSGIPYKLDSDGIDLINRSEAAPKVPFKGSMADRSYLFDTVSKVR